MIQIEKVSKFILSDVTLHIPEGSVTGLIGAAGSGKMTLLRLACGLLAPDCGSVRTMGKNPVLWRMKYASALSVLLTGIPLLEDGISAAEGFELLQKMYALPREEYRRDYRQLSERLGLSKWEKERMKELSAGQRRRVELAAALILRPRLLLLDEPEIGLDEEGKQVLEELIKEYAAAGTTVLITSHDLAGISNMCTRLAVLDEGRLLFYGSEYALRSRYLPISRLTVSFEGNLPNIDDLPIVRYSLEGNRVCYEFNSSYITASEVLAVLMKQTRITDIGIKRPDLEQIMIHIQKTGGKNELYRSQEHQQEV